MRVKVERVSLGWQVEPISDKIKQEIIAHLAQYDVESDGTNFIQSEDEFSEIGESILNLTRANIRDIENGWPVYKNKIDEWAYWHGIVGYMSD